MQLQWDRVFANHVEIHVSDCQGLELRTVTNLCPKALQSVLVAKKHVLEAVVLTVVNQRKQLVWQNNFVLLEMVSPGARVLHWQVERGSRDIRWNHSVQKPSPSFAWLFSMQVCHLVNFWQVITVSDQFDVLIEAT